MGFELGSSGECVSGSEGVKLGGVGGGEGGAGQGTSAMSVRTRNKGEVRVPPLRAAASDEDMQAGLQRVKTMALDIDTLEEEVRPRERECMHKQLPLSPSPFSVA